MPVRLRRSAKVKPYEALAQIYDEVMSHVDYEEWADFVELLLKTHSLTGTSLTEVACGTGTLALELNARGWTITASDASAPMVERAREKITEAAANIPLATCEMKDMPEGNYDAVLCLYDSINYCFEMDEVIASLKGLHRAVHSEGLLIFDASTHANSKRYFLNSKGKVKTDAFSYRRKSVYDTEERIQTNSFDIEIAGVKGISTEVHRQRIYPLSQLEAAIELTPWKIEGCYSGFTLEPGRESSDRVHYVLRAASIDDAPP